MNFKFARYILRVHRNKSPWKIWDKREHEHIQGLLPSFCVPPIISGVGIATNFKFVRYIRRVHPNKSPWKIWENRDRWRIQRLPKFLEYSLLSLEWVKLRTSNFVRTFTWSIGTKAH